MDDCAHFLKSEFSEIEQEENFDFSRRSSIGCGGTAKLAFYPKTVEEWVRLVDCLENCSIPYRVVGVLTNVLPKDGQTDVVYLSTAKFRGVKAGEKPFAFAGTTGGELLKFCEKQGLTGAEFLAGIPCTVGGVAYMNAGVQGRYAESIVESVLFYGDGSICSIPLAECGYAYKTSVFMQKRGVILGVRLRLSKGEGDEIEGEKRRYLERRKHLPKGRSMGCVFKNPPSLVAGKLIEGAGLKGLRIGGAVVSEEHANFIINDKNATAKDIKELIMLIKNAVFAQYKVRLEEEIRYLD